jgi:hypothetical protein
MEVRFWDVLDADVAFGVEAEGFHGCDCSCGFSPMDLRMGGIQEQDSSNHLIVAK